MEIGDAELLINESLSKWLFCLRCRWCVWGIGLGDLFSVSKQIVTTKADNQVSFQVFKPLLSLPQLYFSINNPRVDPLLYAWRYMSTARINFPVTCGFKWAFDEILRIVVGKHLLVLGLCYWTSAFCWLNKH